MRRWLSVVTAVVVLGGCGSKSRSGKPTDGAPGRVSTPPIASAMAPPLTFLKTADIPGDAAFHAKVDDLAAGARIDSSHIGAAGAPSPVFAKFLAVRAAASSAQLAALLRHESPVVRGYVAKDVAAGPFERAQLVPLLADTAHVERRDGCAGGGSSIAELVIEAVCEAKPTPVREELLLEAARAPWLTKPRFHALGCLRGAHAAEAQAILRAEIGKADQPADVLADALRAIPAAGVGACASLLAGPARHADPSVRHQAAIALERCPAPEALPLIERLLGDDMKGVVLYAKVAHAAHPGGDPARVKTWLADPQTAPYIAGALLRSDAPPLLALLVEHLKGPSAPKPQFLESMFHRPPSPAYTAAMRKVVAEIPTHTHFSAPTVRTEALRYLAAVGDPDSLADFRKGLTSSHPRERAFCAEGLGKLRDQTRVAELEALLADRDSMVVNAAATALLALGSKASADKIEAAATGPGAFYKASLQRIVAQLRGEPAPGASAATSASAAPSSSAPVRRGP